MPAIAPPFLLQQYVDNGSPEQQSAARGTLEVLEQVYRRRRVVSGVQSPGRIGVTPKASDNAISVYDGTGLTANDYKLPGKLERGPDAKPAADAAVNQAYDALQDTIDFYQQVMGRDGIDGKGMAVIATVHISDDDGGPLENAFWNGSQMEFGDGGTIFRKGSLTTALDVIAHELTHGVTQFTANLDYHDQPGALNESFSDCFGSMVKQWKAKQSAAQADWLIGAGLLIDTTDAALRSMKSPGSAGPHDVQKPTMSGYKKLPSSQDEGGVHYNSGIPNHAFYLASIALGGNSWDQAGQIWYSALTEHLKHDAQFSDAAEATMEAAKTLFGDAEHAAVEQAWKDVEVLK